MLDFAAYDERFMRRAIELAKKAEGFTNPNPLVGAVIVKDGRIIGEGFHTKYGALHAEREALLDCERRGESAKNATLYVTLEPCCHFGKQPPCTQAVLDSGIAHVVVGSRDPNPLVHGKGNTFLREHGVTVTEDFLRSECDSLNSIFFHYITTKMPYVALKYAMTADGKIATKTGESKWITGQKSREYVHILRNRYAAILCGIGTVLQDDPLLTCRMPGGKNPVRIVCDSQLRISVKSQLVQTAKEVPLIVACSAKYAVAEHGGFEQKKVALERLGAEVLVVEESRTAVGEQSYSATVTEQNSVNLPALLKSLGERKIDSVFVEGGSQIHYSMLKTGLVQKIYAFVAPKVFGGAAKSPVGGSGVSVPSEAFMFSLSSVTRFDDDVLLEYSKL